MCAALPIPVSHRRLHCMETGSRYSLCLSHWQRRERTDVRQRYPEGKLQYIKDAQESEQQPAGRTAERMQERINTFETVLNIDQFLVRFIILYIEMFCNSFCEDWCIHDLNERKKKKATFVLPLTCLFTLNCKFHVVTYVTQLYNEKASTVVVFSWITWCKVEPWART